MHLYNKILCLKIAKKVYEAEAAGLNYSIDGDFAPCKLKFITLEIRMSHNPNVCRKGSSYGTRISDTRIHGTLVAHDYTI